MKVKNLKLVSFRNYPSLNLDLEDGLNIFIGSNAQGKTNILESIYYASTGGSFRSNTDMELINWNAQGCSISVKFQRLDVENKIDIKLQRDKKRIIEYNSHKLSSKELVGALNVVLFCPDDLLLIKGAPAERRRFLDMEISQANPSYYHELIKYNHLLQQRNSLLKKIREKKADSKMLELWDFQLAESAVKITKKRISSVEKFNMLANLMQRRISGNIETLKIEYVIKGREKESNLKRDNNQIEEDLKIWYNKMLGQFREDDIWRGSTSIGPHRDDIVVYVNGINLKSFGSQGQQRTGVLALKLSELEFIRSEAGEYPILLLDDVMSELDKDRRCQLLSFIQRENIQTLITATDEAYFHNYDLNSYLKVMDGQVITADRT